MGIDPYVLQMSALPQGDHRTSIFLGFEHQETTALAILFATINKKNIKFANLIF